jgi:6-pyruvoyl-tetrahydropterin synthase related domain
MSRPGRAWWAKSDMIRRLLRSPATVALLLMIPALLPLAAPGYFFGAHDAHHSVFFFVEFDRSLRDQFPWPVWSPDHALGFGYPLWMVYAPLSFYLAEAFHLLGMGFTAAIKATWALCFLVGAAGMYRLARRWWGPAAALTAALAYTYAPYHLVQIYVRAALAEFAALAWFPWVLLAFARLWDEPRPRWAAFAALAFGALLLIHTVSALIFVPVLLAFLALKFVESRWRRRQQAVPQTPVAPAALVRDRPAVLWAVLALALGGLLSSLFWLPMFMERSLIVESQWVPSTYQYASNFVYPSQFFDPTWGYGYSVPGPNDGMSFQLGIVIVVGATIGALAAFGLRSRSHRTAGAPEQERLPFRAEALFLTGVSLLAIFAMTPASQPVWDALPLVSLVQFPWRLLAVTVTTLALLVGAGVHWLEQRWPAADGPGTFAYVMALALVLASIFYAMPELQAIRPQDESPIAVMEFELAYPDMRGSTVWAERQPANEDSPLLPQYLAGEPLRRAAIVAGSGEVLEQSSRAASAYARVRADTSVRLRFYTYYFPGWRATVDGQAAAVTPDPPNGLIGLTLAPGEHEVRLRFGPTPVRVIGAALSVLALAAVLGLFWVDRKSSRPDLATNGPIC